MNLELILETAASCLALKPNLSEENPDGYDKAIIGLTDNGQLVYSKEIMVKLLRKDNKELSEEDVGTLCGLFEVQQIGDEYFTFMTECKNPTACSIILRGASKDVLNEMERNLHDCLAVAKNIFVYPKLLTGGGSIEMEISSRLEQKANTMSGLQ